jgi:hypothetical protein
MNKIIAVIRNSKQFNNVEENHVDQYSTNVDCIAKDKKVTLDDVLLRNLILIAKKADYIFSVVVEGRKVCFYFTERSFT